MSPREIWRRHLNKGQIAIVFRQGAPGPSEIEARDFFEKSKISFRWSPSLPCRKHA